MTKTQLVTYHSVIGVYKIRKSGEPEYLAEILLPDNIRRNIIIPVTELTLAKNSFCYREAESWNIIPEAKRSIAKIASFKREVRKWIKMRIPRFLE